MLRRLLHLIIFTGFIFRAVFALQRLHDNVSLDRVKTSDIADNNAYLILDSLKRTSRNTAAPGKKHFHSFLMDDPAKGKMDGSESKQLASPPGFYLSVAVVTGLLAIIVGAVVVNAWINTSSSTGSSTTSSSSIVLLPSLKVEETIPEPVILLRTAAPLQTTTEQLSRDLEPTTTTPEETTTATTTVTTTTTTTTTTSSSQSTKDPFRRPLIGSIVESLFQDQAQFKDLVVIAFISGQNRTDLLKSRNSGIAK